MHSSAAIVVVISDTTDFDDETKIVNDCFDESLL